MPRPQCVDRRPAYQYENMSNQILHEGKIISIDGAHLRVSIVQQSACASCKIAGACMASESKVKEVDVWTADTAPYAVGQTVTVAVSSSVGAWAVVVGFVVPAVIVVLGVVAALLVTAPGSLLPVAPPYDQAVAALAGLALLIPYYIALYMARDKIRRRVTFTIA